MLIQIIIFCLFLCLIVHLVRNEKLVEIILVFLALTTVTIGEALNLFVYKMAVYHGYHGIPIYIILGGAVLSWSIYKSAFIIQKKYNIDCIFVRLFFIILISLMLPIIEVFGLKTGLWYWRRPYSILTLGWFLGVWKFYFLFIVTPALVGQVFNNKNTQCCIN